MLCFLRMEDNLSEENLDEDLIHDLPVESKNADMSMKKAFAIFGLFIVAGLITGFVVNYVSDGIASNSGSKSTSEKIGKDDVVESEGIADKDTFKDSAEGTLKAGGSEGGVGSFNLERPGGESQTVYLTSSTVDLSKFIEKKVRVHGETFDNEEVGWLMDVGFVEVIK